MFLFFWSKREREREREREGERGGELCRREQWDLSKIYSWIWVID